MGRGHAAAGGRGVIVGPSMAVKSSLTGELFPRGAGELGRLAVAEGSVQRRRLSGRPNIDDITDFLRAWASVHRRDWLFRWVATARGFDPETMGDGKDIPPCDEGPDTRDQQRDGDNNERRFRTRDHATAASSSISASHE